MNQPHDQDPRDSSLSPFVRPAPSSPMPADQDDLTEPLAPFFGGLQEVEIGGQSGSPDTGADADSAGATEDESGADDIPWLLREDREDAGNTTGSPQQLDSPAYLGGVPEVDLDAEPQIISFDDLQPDAEPEPEPVREVAREAPQRRSEPSEGGAWHSAFGPPATELETTGAPADSGSDPGRELHVEQAGGFREAASVLAEEVAVRLERIAQSLRSRNTSELLADSGDPLEILIIGYVLGSSRGSREPTGDQASSL